MFGSIEPSLAQAVGNRCAGIDGIQRGPALRDEGCRIGVRGDVLFFVRLAS